MSGGIFYPVTPRDIREAILLCNLRGSNKCDTLWCGDGRPPKKHGAAPCGHSDDWWCAADALGMSSDAVHLMIRATNAVEEAWSNLEARGAESLNVLALRRMTKLFDADLEAEALLHAGWLPSDYYLVKRHQKDRGEYIALHWEDEPSAYYVRGFVTIDEFHAALRSYFGDRAPQVTGIRQCYAFYAFSGRDDWGNPTRTLRETLSRNGTFAVTVMEPARASTEAA
jgi:hypothetical protein